MRILFAYEPEEYPHEIDFYSALFVETLQENHEVKVYIRRSEIEPIPHIEDFDIFLVVYSYRFYRVINVERHIPIWLVIYSVPDKLPENVTRYLAHGELLRNTLVKKFNVPEDKVDLLPYFAPETTVVKRIPLRALFIGNLRNKSRVKFAIEVSIRAGLPIDIVGEEPPELYIPSSMPVKFLGKVSINPRLLINYGIVFASGIFAVMALSAGIPCVVVGDKYTDGLITPLNIARGEYSNFQGLSLPMPYVDRTCDLLACEIKNMLEYYDKLKDEFSNLHKRYLRENLLKIFSESTREKESKAMQNTLEDYRKILTNEPENVNAWVCAGKLIYESSSKEDALKHFIRACELDPTNEEAVKHLFKVALELNRVDIAENYLKIFVDKTQNIDAMYTLATLYYKTGSYQKCKRILHTILELNPENSAAKDLLNKLGYL